MADDTPVNPIEDAGPSEEEIAAREAREAKMAPLLDIVRSEAFAEVLNGLTACHADFIGESIGYSHLYGVMSTMPRLRDWAESEVA